MTRPDDAAAALPGLVRRTVDRLVRAFSPERILVFGSFAKGTTTTASDIDLLVIAHLPGNRGLHRRRARALAADCFPRVDIVLATPEEVQEAAGSPLPFLASILDTGIAVYIRDQPTAALGRP